MSGKIALCILTRFMNDYWVDFLRTFNTHDVFLVIDDNTIHHSPHIENVNIVQVSDEQCINAHYFKSSCWSNLKDIVAWDRALYYFNHVRTDYEHVWFIEDDVFFMDENIITNIDNQYPSTDLICAFHDINHDGNAAVGWNHWYNIIHRINPPWAHSLVAISRLSRRLLNDVDNYVKGNTHLIFIEALFNTLALHNSYSIAHPECISNTVTYDTQWNIKDLDIKNIYHPLKKIDDHKYIREHYNL